MTASPAARILVALQGSKGKTARQLAAELGLDKGEVNRLLYRDLASRVRKLTGYTWVLRDDAAPQPAGRRPEEGRPAPAGPLARLCSYYLDCLLQQDEKGVSVFASGQHGVDYEELADLPVLSGDHAGAFQRPGAARLLAKARQDRGSTCIYLLSLIHI